MLAVVVGAAAGLLASLGRGGGFVLLVYLVLSGASEQMAAQGQNLVFFLPVIAVSLILHIKNKLIDFKTALTAGLSGLVTVVLGFLLATRLEGDLLKKLFAVFVIVAGLHDLFAKKKKPDPDRE